MKRIILTYGLMIGIIITAHMVYMVGQLYDNPDMEANAVLGYAVMIIVFSLSYFGIRSYRNKHLGGIISLGRAFKVGALIVFIASTVYVGVWLVYYYLFVPDFMDLYTAHVLEATPPAELEAKREEMQQFNEMYENPLFVVLISYFEILPVGLVVAFVNSLILKKKIHPQP